MEDEVATGGGGDEFMETSYHLAGSDVTREDDVLRRQQRYCRGTIADGASSKVGSRRGRRRRDALFGVGGDGTVSDGGDDDDDDDERVAE